MNLNSGQKFPAVFLLAVFLLATLLATFLGAGSIAGVLVAQGRKDYSALRKKLVDEAIVPAGVRDPRVLQSIRTTKRHEFVPLSVRKQAYEDMALPIGEKQTISSPFIVAYMTESLQPQPTDKVLEIGTGSGYQAAILSPLVKHVYSIEIVPQLGRKAAATLKRLRYKNVTTKIGDGFKGWAEHGPFDKVIVTCSPEKVPQALVDQLRDGGLMVIPVGERYQQTLYLLRKRDGKLVREALRPTLFVPMTGTAEERRAVKPNAARPQVINGDFEQPGTSKLFFAGWYYQRQAERVTSGTSPQGTARAVFKNLEPGKASHALQGFAIDGAAVRELEVTAKVKYDKVAKGRTRDESAMIVVSFYDKDRRDLGYVSIGPFLASRDWHQVAKKTRVPARAKEGILRVGLFGATGTLEVDDLKFRFTPR